MGGGKSVNWDYELGSVQDGIYRPPFATSGTQDRLIERKITTSQIVIIGGPSNRVLIPIARGNILDSSNPFKTGLPILQVQGKKNVKNLVSSSRSDKVP